MRRARAFLLDTMTRLRAEGLTRLPTVAQLAKSGRCSTHTMSAALHLLQRDGYLQARQRSGIHTTGLFPPREPLPAPEAAAAGPKRAHWEDVSEKLLADILQGECPPGSVLSTAKELSRCHGAGLATVSKALGSLCASGKLVRHGRGYRVFGAAPLP